MVIFAAVVWTLRFQSGPSKQSKTHPQFRGGYVRPVLVWGLIGGREKGYLLSWKVLRIDADRLAKNLKNGDYKKCHAPDVKI